jgi:hypothetical protein
MQHFDTRIRDDALAEAFVIDYFEFWTQVRLLPLGVSTGG